MTTKSVSTRKFQPILYLGEQDVPLKFLTIKLAKGIRSRLEFSYFDGNLTVPLIGHWSGISSTFG